MPFWIDPPIIKLTAWSINIICAVILTLRVILVPEGSGITNGILYAVVGLNLCTFLMLIWAQLLTRSYDKKRRYLMEKRFGIDFTDISGVTDAEIKAFEEEKQYKLPKAKD